MHCLFAGFRVPWKSASFQFLQRSSSDEVVQKVEGQREKINIGLGVVVMRSALRLRLYSAVQCLGEQECLRRDSKRAYIFPCHFGYQSVKLCL